MSTEYGTTTADDVIGGIRLAIEGAANPETALAVIEELCQMAPPTNPTATRPASMLIQAIQEVKGTFVVSENKDRQR